MIILDSTNKSLQIVLGGNVTTNQLPFISSYVDLTSTTFTPITQDGQSNNTTAVTVMSSPAASTQRQLKYLQVYNADTVQATVIVQFNNNSTLRTLLNVNLQPSYTLTYNVESGWTVTDTNGFIQTVGNAGPPSGTAGGDLGGTYPNPTVKSVADVTTGTLGLSNGGTNNALSANNGGIVYSDSSKLDILAGTATADQVLMSGSSSAPSWSTATYPPDAAANDLIYASGAHAFARLATANSSILITDASGNVAWRTVLPSGTTATTQSAGDNSTKVATTAYIDGQMNLGVWVDFSGTAALTNASSITYYNCRYCKIGKTCIIFFEASFTNTGNSKTITLPFTAARTGRYTNTLAYNYNGSGAVTVSQVYTNSNTTLSISYGFSGGAWPTGTVAGCAISFMLTYETT